MGDGFKLLPLLVVEEEVVFGAEGRRGRDGAEVDLLREEEEEGGGREMVTISSSTPFEDGLEEEGEVEREWMMDSSP